MKGWSSLGDAFLLMCICKSSVSLIFIPFICPPTCSSWEYKLQEVSVVLLFLCNFTRAEIIITVLYFSAGTVAKYNRLTKVKIIVHCTDSRKFKESKWCSIQAGTQRRSPWADAQPAVPAPALVVGPFCTSQWGLLSWYQIFRYHKSWLIMLFQLFRYIPTHLLTHSSLLSHCLITRPLAFSLTHTLTHPFTRFSFISPFGYTIWSSNTFNPLTSSNFTSYDTLVLASLINIPALYWALRRQFNTPRSIRLLSLMGQKQCPFVFMVTEYLFCGDINLNRCGWDNGKLGDNPALAPGASGSEGQALKKKQQTRNPQMPPKQVKL